MASNSPFQVEDQTDEDFFDKLVDDDFDPAQASASSSVTVIKLEDGNDSDDARAFANLSISGNPGGDDTLLDKAEPGGEVANAGIDGLNLMDTLDAREDVPSSNAAEAAEFTGDYKDESSSEELRAKVEQVSVTETTEASRKMDGSGGSGIKEVDWSSFYADSSVHNGHGLGSYSDLLGVFEESAKEDVTFGENIFSNNINGLDNSTSGQGEDNSQYWENLYPGWKYDANTGQWYQINGNEEDKTSQETTYGHLAKESSQTVVGAVPETVSSWNQVNNGYPEHMVFDPQYPGWYYDTLSQEWLTLDADSYKAAAQIQNGHASNGNQSQHVDMNQSYYASNQPDMLTWQSESAARADAASLSYNQQDVSMWPMAGAAVTQTYEKASQGQFMANQIGAQSFIPQQTGVGIVQPIGPNRSLQSSRQFTPDGRPPHALVSFGFGGKLIVLMPDNGYSLKNLSDGNQGAQGRTISVCNMAEVFSGDANSSSMGGDMSDYISCLCQQSFPGPLVGGNVGSKDLNKWLDERILNIETREMDFSRGKLLRLLLSLLKISCQYYGKLRSPYGADTKQKEIDTPEAAVVKLLAMAKNDSFQNKYAALSQCLQPLPSEAQMQVTASEVQSLLVRGRRMEALQYAQEGRLWGPALVIASQLGDQFYVDTVKQMALWQLVPGAPLRTLCLLIAGQPADVFSTGTSGDSSLPASMNTSQPHSQFVGNSMLDNWEENLAVMTTNRTKDDELVITHLGDCLWRERGEIIAAHICYIIAERNFEPYSDAARLCLVGANHLKYPRTFASPEAIQMTELYEYSKVLGNSQYTLLPFQPYKLIYAYMLAEIGKVSVALKYCQAMLKCLKTGRAAEVETWKQQVIMLEERIRIHQQGGYTANLAPAKLVGKLLNFFDNTAHRVVGTMPPPAPSSSPGNFQVHDFHHQQRADARVSTIPSAMTVSSLIPPASTEPIRHWDGDASKMSVQGADVSKPQDEVGELKEKGVDGVTHEKSSAEGSMGSRFSRFGLGILKKTVGRVLQARPGREAKLGEENKFYYDEKLKRWVEKGGEAPAEEAALPPPPTMATFRNSSSPGGDRSLSTPTPSQNSSGMPPIPSGSNQFSARGRMGVRARYVDTFNKGGGNSGTMFQSASVAPAKPSMPSTAKLFIPTTPMTSTDAQEQHDKTEEDETLAMASSSSSSSAAAAMERMQQKRFEGMDSLIQRTGSATNVKGALPQPHSQRRTASWSGSFNNKWESYSPSSSSSRFASSPLNHSSSSLGDELQEVEL